MATTIQVSGKLQETLSKMKLFQRETYEEVIWNLIEDTSEINESTKKELEISRSEFKKGKSFTLEQIKKKSAE